MNLRDAGRGSGTCFGLTCLVDAALMVSGTTHKASALYTVGLDKGS